MFSSYSLGQFYNTGAFAAIRQDGSVLTWGNTDFGGNSSAVASQLDGSVPVTALYCSNVVTGAPGASFAALRADGSVTLWGDYAFGGNAGALAADLDGTIDVTRITAAQTGFAALRADGSVISWGLAALYHETTYASVATSLQDVTRVFSNEQAFAAVRSDGSVVTWGATLGGGNGSSLLAGLDGQVDVVNIFSTRYAFAGLREDGSVVTWGDSYPGGDSSSVASLIDGTVDVIDIVANEAAFAALRSDGSIVVWGDEVHGGSYIASNYSYHQVVPGVSAVDLASTSTQFAAICNDGSVVTWGYTGYDGATISAGTKLDGTNDAIQIVGNDYSFAAIRSDGSVVTWGAAYYGGDSSAVASALDGSVDVLKVYSNSTAFAALRADGSVVTWGSASGGGDSSAVAAALDGTIDVVGIYSTGGAFAALREDGTVVTWGVSNRGGDTSRAGDCSPVSGPLVDVVGMSGDLSRLLNGTVGDDNLGSGANDERLCGFSGNDTLTGGGGFDTLAGGAGNDVYYLTDNNSIVLETWQAGTDLVCTTLDHYRLAENVENARITSSGAADLTGNALGNMLYAGNGNNVLLGGAGLDTVSYAYAGAAVSVSLATTASQVTLGSGSDTIAEVENLAGSSFNDTLTGSAAANELNGGAGADSMMGGAGDDTYYVDRSSDRITEALAEGNDLVYSAVSLTLAENLERLTLTGSSDLYGKGNTLGNVLTGNGANNELYGLAGNDLLSGALGNDLLSGSSGNDTLAGGKGLDTLTGGSGKDFFRFDTTLSRISNKDLITDFVAVDDSIQLENAIFANLTKTGVLASANFRVGSKAADANDYIIYNQSTGALYYDADGSGSGSAVQFAVLGSSTHPALTAADFLVI